MKLKTILTASAALLGVATTAQADAQTGYYMRQRLIGIPTSANAPAATPTPAPTTGQWVTCAQNAQQCDFSGTTSVRYGVDGAYNTLTETDGVRCQDDIFGDPAFRQAKHCDYDSTTAVPQTWASCGVYGDNCNVPYTTIVRMGKDGYYLKKQATTFIPCTISAFGGDPYQNGAKYCEYLVVSGATPTPTPTPAAGTVNAIIVNSSSQGCLQIGELEVYSSGTNVALAANGGVVSSSAPYSAAAGPANANDGVKPAAYPNVFHSQCNAGDFLRIDFSRPVKVDTVTIYGRTDYPSRDVYDYSLYSGSTVASTGHIDATSGSGSSTPTPQ